MLDVKDFISLGFNRPSKRHMRFKKVDNQWLFFGDQIPTPFNFTPYNVQLNEVIHPGFMVKTYRNINESSINFSSQDLFNIDVSSDDLGGATPVSVISNLSYRLGCTDNVDHCNSFIKISSQSPASEFIKVNVQIDGQTYYFYSSSPLFDSAIPSEFPIFTSIPSTGLCSSNIISTEFPSLTTFTIPLSHLNPSYYDYYSRAAMVTSNAVSALFERGDSNFYVTTSSESFNISKLALWVTSVKSNGIHYRNVYSCGP